MQLHNKVCLVAGASGAIGSAVAERFYEEGACLVLTYLTRSRTAMRLQQNNAGSVLELKMDVRDAAQVSDQVAKTKQRFGRINVLVNCTGVLGPVGKTSGVPIESWVETLETN